MYFLRMAFEFRSKMFYRGTYCSDSADTQFLFVRKCQRGDFDLIYNDDDKLRGEVAEIVNAGCRWTLTYPSTLTLTF